MTKEVVKKENSFVAPVMNEAVASLNEELSLDGDDGLTFVRATVAPSGVKQFVIKDDDEETMVAELQGVIVHAHPAFAMWAKKGEETEDNTPLCSSIDGVHGIDRDGIEIICKTCPYNQFGSAEEGKGKRCKNGYRIYLLQKDESLPISVSVSPTSKNTIKKYLKKLLFKENIPYYGAITNLTVSKKESNGNSYGVIVPKFVEKIDGDLSFFATMHDEIKEASKRFTIESDTFDYEKEIGATDIKCEEETVRDN